ncbi:integrase arm-type DNA-binding domain-containing protein [Laribacter hongkongensis]|uniref:integrase arm-type DNA-binding domain-containing protein n=1 Tax=Laribacter hongkongensis TaxID=168471 RepID=UPI0009DB8896|nr:integrase arm-type DNA-binding domain-containing protein [Laribacter hongkongensis]
MARTTVPLTDAACRNAKPKDRDYSLFDGQGLYLLVKTNGIKLWRMKYIKPNGKQGLTSFGNYPAISLAIARELRAKAIDLLAMGTDPVVHKPRQQASRLLPTSSKPSRGNGTTRYAASGAMTMPGASSSDRNRTCSQPSESI